jgi:hypothetical protein
MKKKLYMAPAINITKITLQPLLNTISGVDGDTGVENAGEDEEIPGTANSRRKSAWDEEEDEEW